MAVTEDDSDGATGVAAHPAAEETRTAGTTGFIGWALGAYAAGTAALVLAVLVALRGRFGYVLDDPAIHLSVAEHVVHDGTWGVTQGRFESASSSPLWTLLLAGAVGVAPPVRHVLPLLMNLAAGAGLVVILARTQDVLRPRDRRLDAVAVVALVTLVTLVLMLPGLALVGMEHTLHCALVVATVALVHRRALGIADRWPRWAPAALLVAATLTRFETAFVAVGLAGALVAARVESDGRVVAVRSRSLRIRVSTLLVAGVAPIVAIAAINVALGGGLLPNSVLAKGRLASGGLLAAVGPSAVAGRLTHDPALLSVVVLAGAYVVVRWNRGGRALVPAVTLLVAGVLHVALAEVGWYERYQSYLLAIGVYLVLCVLAEVPAPLRSRAVALVAVLAVVLAVPKIDLMRRVPVAADDVYRHHQTAGRFLDRYYDGEAIATSQLGYVSLLHEGPVTDLAGLGDREVLDANRAGRADRAFLTELTEERDIRVAVLYPGEVLDRAPESWARVGAWRLDGQVFEPDRAVFEFWAASPDEIAPLAEHLRAFEPDMPAGVTLVLNPLAGWDHG